jgi:hypothetical protein
MGIEAAASPSRSWPALSLTNGTLESLKRLGLLLMTAQPATCKAVFETFGHLYRSADASADECSSIPVIVAALIRQGVVSSSLQLSGVWSQVRTQVLALPPFAQKGPGRGISRVARARACAAGKCGWDSPVPKNENSGVREISSPSGFWRGGVLARALSAAVTVGAGAGGPRPCRPGRAPAGTGSARRGRLQPIAEIVSPRTVGCGNVWNVAGIGGNASEWFT